MAGSRKQNGLWMAFCSGFFMQVQKVISTWWEWTP